MNKILSTALLTGGLLAASSAVLAYGPGPYAPYGSPAYSAPSPAAGSVSLRRVNTPDAYVLEIYLHGLEPSAVEVERQGYELRIHSSRQTDQDYSDGRGGYSFQHSFSNFNRRVRVPLNADMHAMERSDSEQLITIRIPKTAQY